MIEQFFRNIPPVVKNLLIINILMFVATIAIQDTDLRNILGLYNFKSPLFEPYQLVTYMFMHGDFTHLLFNMFSLVMFGSILEQVWGPKRFLMFYFITGIGAVFLYQAVAYFEYAQAVQQIGQSAIENINAQIVDPSFNGSVKILGDAELAYARSIAIPLVGASGALFGIMIAFGVLFPNTELMLIFFPVPIKAKYFIPGMILLELYLGVMQFAGDNVAHFAHLGGALIGYILMKLWQKDRKNFY
ncbi:MAG: rhomboid family intramembrane serine protease [Bacteroidota bacterium]